MRSRIPLFLIACGMPYYGPIAIAAGQDKNAVVAQVMASRKALPGEYHLEFTVVTKRAQAGVPESPESSKVSVWSRGSLLRTDELVLSGALNKKDIGRRVIRCRNCERPGYSLFTKVGSKSAINIVEFNKIDAEVDRNDGWRIDWRGLGLLGYGLAQYGQFPMTQTMDMITGVSNCTVESVHLGETACVLVTVPVRSARGMENSRVWFGKDVGLNPVRFEDAGGILQTTDITYQKIKNLNAWYPKTIRHIRNQGGRVFFDESITVESVSFGERLPDETFQLSGLKLDEQQPIAFPEIKRANDFPIWRNGKLDREYTGEMQALDGIAWREQQSNLSSPVPDRAPPSDRWYYYSGAAFLVILAGLLAYFARRK